MHQEELWQTNFLYKQFKKTTKVKGKVLKFSDNVFFKDCLLFENVIFCWLFVESASEFNPKTSALKNLLLLMNHQRRNFNGGKKYP